MDIHVVMVNGDDPFPELRAFRELDDAVAYANALTEARGGDSTDIAVLNMVPLISHGSESRHIIVNASEGTV